MNDVELLFCTYPGHPELAALVELARDKQRPRDQRAESLRRLRVLADAEVTTARDRWTPFYDRALRSILGGGDELIAEEWYDDYGCGPFGGDGLGGVASALAIHGKFVRLFEEAIARGARLLSDAFDLVSIKTSEANEWFTFVPDQEALLAQLQDAARRCVARLEPATGLEIRTDLVLVRAITVARSVADIWELRNAPLELFEELGNPFLPKLQASFDSTVARQ